MILDININILCVELYLCLKISTSLSEFFLSDAIGKLYICVCVCMCVLSIISVAFNQINMKIIHSILINYYCIGYDK